MEEIKNFVAFFQATQVGNVYPSKNKSKSYTRMPMAETSRRFP